jgi:hypothetical protein
VRLYAPSAADDKWRMRLLHRSRVGIDTVETDLVARVVRVFLSPDGDHRLDVLVGAPSALRHWRAKGLRLFWYRADADANDESPTREHIDAGELLGEEQRVVLRQEQHARAELQSLGECGEVADDGDGVEKRRGARADGLFGRQVRQNDMLGGPERFVAEVVHELRQPAEVRHGKIADVESSETEVHWGSA